MRPEDAQRLPIRQVPPPGAALVELDLEDLAGHRGLRHAVAFHEAHRLAHLGHADPFERVAKFRQRRIAMIFNAERYHAVTLFLERFGNCERKASPPGDEADGLGGYRSRNTSHRCTQMSHR